MKRRNGLSSALGVPFRTASVVMIAAILSSLVLFSSVFAKEELADPVEGPGQEQLQVIEKEEEKPIAEPAPAKTLALAEYLPEDSSPVFNVQQIQLEGNTLLSQEQLFKRLPGVFDASGEYKIPPDSSLLYDFRGIQALVLDLTQAQSISARTMQGLTQYLLFVYQQYHYAGIYVYIPEGAMAPDGPLSQGILPIRILEAAVSTVGINSFDVANQATEESYLSRNWLSRWSPAQEQQKLDDKELQDFISILNLNPDRYVSAVVGQGTEPQTLSVNYNLYEANPWHWFVQADNSGTKDRQWTPRIGLINTNVLGFDDKLTAIYQTPFDNDFGEEYAVFGSYDFPIAGPDLRLNLYGGYNEYDISGLGSINFIGRGHFYGGQLRWHALQREGWFLDLTGMLQHEESQIVPSEFPQFLASNVEYDLWGCGIEIYREQDRQDTFFSLNRVESFSGSDQADFNQARNNSDRDFSILTATARHSRYLDPDKVQRVTTSFEWIDPDERLVPSQMRTFGGMYSVRGYDEYEIVADGGILSSLQYEYDIIRADQVSFGSSEEEEEIKPLIRKLAPLVFLDYGLAKVESPLDSGEHKDQELFSCGGGCTVELGDNFTGVIYYGYPLIDTARTHTGKGRVNVGFLIRW